MFRFTVELEDVASGEEDERRAAQQSKLEDEDVASGKRTSVEQHSTAGEARIEDEDVASGE